MGTQYFCDNQRRARIIRNDPTISLNGIDYLEVLDSEAPDPSLRQRTLLVRLLRPVPAGLGASNVRIEGGVRVTPIGVEWAVAAGSTAALLADGLITPAENAFYSSLPEPDRLLLVRTDSDGDFSAYVLKLVNGPFDDAPPAGFDPILCAVSFSFKVECPTEFDCQPDEDCPPEAESQPVINYLARDFNSFRQLILDRLAVTNLSWQERHLPDLNIALVEVLAYLGDYLSYWQDAAATEAYLGTARRRISLRRHARLLAYPMHDGSTARAWVQFEVEAGADGAQLLAPETLADPPVRLLTRMPGEPVQLDESDFSAALRRHTPVVFELRTTVTLRRAHNRIRFHTWGDEICCLPAGATRATLVSTDNPTDALDLTPGDVLIFEETISPETEKAADADLGRRQAVRLVEVLPGRDPLFDVPVVDIRWADEDALAFPLCLSKRSAEDNTLLEDMGVARGNVALADRGLTLDREALPAPKTAAHRPYRPTLSRTGVTLVAPVDPDRPRATILTRPDPAVLDREPYVSDALSARYLLAFDVRLALPAVELAGDGQSWHPQRDLLDSDRFAPHFVAEIESDGHISLRFGDGRVYGVAPSDNAFSRDDASVPAPGAIYRIGTGAAGNVGADTVAHIVGQVAGIARVRNPLPATGGSEPESLEEVRQYAPQAFRRQERAVTADDYAMVTERHPAVQRAVATRRWTGSWHTMFVTVDRRRGLPLTDAFETELCRHIEPYRLAGHDVEVDGPRFAPLDIRFTVCVKPGYFRSNVKQSLLEVFSNRLLRDGRRGFFHPDNYTFGQPVYLSEVIATAMGVTGVQWVDFQAHPDKDHRFQRWGRAPNDELAQGRIALSRLEIARLDNDPSLPENGKLVIYMEGGL